MGRKLCLAPLPTRNHLAWAGINKYIINPVFFFPPLHPKSLDFFGVAPSKCSSQMCCKGGQVNYCLPCLQTKLQVWPQDFLDIWGKQDLEEMKNFKTVKALGVQSSWWAGEGSNMRREGGWRWVSRAGSSIYGSPHPAGTGCLPYICGTQLPEATMGKQHLCFADREIGLSEWLTGITNIWTGNRTLVIGAR